jgi:hypothetical protein
MAAIAAASEAMRTVIHAGLHKSGTTTVQHAWERWYGQPGACWYPPPGGNGPGHATAAFAHRFDPVAQEIAQLDRSMGDIISLQRYVEQAQARSVKTLVLSSEEFDQLSDDERAALAEIFDPGDLTILFTATRPTHRWFSVWQELVKHGLPARPAQAATLVANSAMLTPGDLERLLLVPPTARVLVRLVQTDPPEADLARALAQLLDLPVPDDATDESPPVNVSIGAAAELLRDLNAHGETIGLLAPESTSRFETALRMRTPMSEFAAPKEDFAMPPAVAAAAAEEQRFLRSLRRSGSVELVDPLGLLDDWTSTAGPRWLDEVMQRAWSPYDGSGMDGWNANHVTTRQLADAQVAATRGPTSERLLTGGRGAHGVYGDPVWLLPRFYDPKLTKKWDLGVILHLSELTDREYEAHPEPKYLRYGVPGEFKDSVHLINTVTPISAAPTRASTSCSSEWAVANALASFPPLSCCC